MTVIPAIASDAATEGRQARHDRLVELMERRGLGAVLLRTHSNFAWYTGGADSRVDHASPLGVADLLVTPDAALVLTTNIEATRLRAEHLPWAETVPYPWTDEPLRAAREIAGGVAIGCDVPLADGADVTGEIALLRRVLDPDAIARLRDVGTDARAALEEAAGVVQPGLSERELAAAIAAACVGRGLVPSVLLAAGDERIGLWRHPIPDAGAVQRRAMLVVSAERGGLYANLTRFVELDDPPPELARRIAACDRVLARMREATQPGRTLAEVFAHCRRFYAEADFPDEWRLHHQGGITGYASREVIATPNTHDVIEEGHAFAWNPSITGAKSEETFVLTASGPEVVTGVTADHGDAV